MSNHETTKYPRDLKIEWEWTWFGINHFDFGGDNLWIVRFGFGVASWYGSPARVRLAHKPAAPSSVIEGLMMARLAAEDAEHPAIDAAIAKIARLTAEHVEMFATLEHLAFSDCVEDDDLIQAQRLVCRIKEGSHLAEQPPGDEAEGLMIRQVISCGQSRFTLFRALAPNAISMG